MKKVYFILVLALLLLISCTAYWKSNHIKIEKESTVENTDIAEDHIEVETGSDLPEMDLLESWLGAYEQSGTLWDEIRSSLDFYIYREDGTYYGYLCVSGSEAGTLCYFDERILTEIRGNEDMIEVYFLEKQQLNQGCYHEEYPDIFSTACGESKLDEAISMYEKQEILFTLIRDEGACSAIEGNMRLGKNPQGAVNDFSQCRQLTIDIICDNDSEVFLKMFREREPLTELEEPSYNGFDNNGKLILNLYLNQEKEKGVGIFYGETMISRYITRFDIDSWQPQVWEDNKYSLMRAGEEAVTALNEYQEYREYNDQGQITNFYSEGIISGWGDPRKEKLVQVEFSYRDDATLERKSCYYNQRLYGTTRQSETFYFNESEQLTYGTAYITHGMLSNHYFYDADKEEPVYCLILDHMGYGCYGDLLKYDYIRR